MSKNTNYSSGQPFLGQLLSFFPRNIFEMVVLKYNSDLNHGTVSTWDQFVFMLYGILTGHSSLREIGLNLTLMGDGLAQCGVKSVPARSSISDANRDRNANVFGDLYLSLLQHFSEELSDSYLHMVINGEIDPKSVEIFDSTTISLFKDVYKNCGRLPENGKKKGGIKAFTKITLSDRIPNLICLKAASTNEKQFLSQLKLPIGTIAVFDKGFQSYHQYQQWNDAGIFYVTRLNQNATFKILKIHKLEEINEHGVMQDADIELEYICKTDSKKKKVVARMVNFIDPETKEKLHFLSNLPEAKALTICMLYKNRWTIEPLFKQLKQNFELTYFLSDSQEGIKTQIWIALILNLIFTVIHKRVKEAIDFTTVVKLVAKNAICYVKFIEFLKNPLILQQRKVRNLEIIQYDLFKDKKRGVFKKSEKT
jgi:hypothetical protein